MHSIRTRGNKTVVNSVELDTRKLSNQPNQVSYKFVGNVHMNIGSSFLDSSCTDATQIIQMSSRIYLRPRLYVAFSSRRMQFKQQIMNDNEANHLIIYCFNCIRCHQNATYNLGLCQASISITHGHTHHAFLIRLMRDVPTLNGQ